MSKQYFFVSRDMLDYGLQADLGESNFEQEGTMSELPSVSYLTIKYENELYLPISIFQSNLAPLQVVVKYLKEVKGLQNRQIAHLLDRDVRTIWSTYAAVKNKKPLVLANTSLTIPLSAFKNSQLSILESLVSFLRESNLTYADIARMIGRDQRTVWTVHARFKNKVEKWQK
ncbi:MAG: hypothetical protein V1866_00780 [archaeon]